MSRVPARARAHILAHPRQPRHEAAAALGVTYHTVRTYRAWLIKEGALPSLRPRINLDDVRDLAADGLTADEVARRLRRSPDGVLRRLYREDETLYTVRADSAYSISQVAAILGMPSRHGRRRISALVASGALRGRPSKRSGSRATITAAALMEFLERPDCPIDPARIADPDWRAYALDARAGRYGPVRALSAREVRRAAAAAD